MPLEVFGIEGKNDALRNACVRAEFDDRFQRCRASLFLVACRVVGSASRASEVVERCYSKTSGNPPQFEDEGAWGSWLLRTLIDEALLVRGRDAKGPLRRVCFGASKSRMPKNS